MSGQEWEALRSALSGYSEGELQAFLDQLLPPTESRNVGTAYARLSVAPPRSPHVVTSTVQWVTPDWRAE